MQIILYLSIAVIAIAFFILVIYLSKTLKSLQITLDSVSKTLIGLEGQLEGVTRETTALLEKTNALAEDVQHKSESLNSVVIAVKEVGDSVRSFNGSIQKITSSVNEGLEENKERISQVVQWGQVLMELKDKWKMRKQPETQEVPVDKPTPQKRWIRERS
ncbi:DUF948 domain-containing protein [Bacillus sp. S/N-304-OC-R1]|uniref:DUF948 domain-containing protein n=1 Tax=Bacillus sp. S/N-304-OC-R1 TaxID=2758034 RepID=UPI001C8DF81C|nr:DUF948 domain-containing protein [Bacillus sp. S/N-304-OC-R1]MBY0124131.1 DUF948 domain-containing protein [Bacillus sp. S/N-304-OC-R1]